MTIFENYPINSDVDSVQIVTAKKAKISIVQHIVSNTEMVEYTEVLKVLYDVYGYKMHDIYSLCEACYILEIQPTYINDFNKIALMYENDKYARQLNRVLLKHIQINREKAQQEAQRKMQQEQERLFAQQAQQAKQAIKTRTPVGYPEQSMKQTGHVVKLKMNNVKKVESPFDQRLKVMFSNNDVKEVVDTPAVCRRMFMELSSRPDVLAVEVRTIGNPAAHGQDRVSKIILSYDKDLGYNPHLRTGQIRP